MKQFFLVVTLTIAVVLTTAASPAPTNNPKVEKAFSTLFAGATNVSWSKVEGNYMKASFIWADHQTVAFFGADAKLIGSIRGLFFNQLPLSVIRSFNSSFSDHIVLEVREISNEEGVNYTVLTEHKDKKFRIRISSLGDVVEKERVKK